MKEEIWNLKIGYVVPIQIKDPVTGRISRGYEHNLHTLDEKLQRIPKGTKIGLFEPYYFSREDISEQMRIGMIPGYKSKYEFIRKKRLQYGEFIEISEFEPGLRPNPNFPPHLTVYIDDATEIISWDNDKTMKIFRYRNDGHMDVNVVLGTDYSPTLFLVGKQEIAEIIRKEFLGKYRIIHDKYYAKDTSLEMESEILSSQ